MMLIMLHGDGGKIVRAVTFAFNNMVIYKNRETAFKLNMQHLFSDISDIIQSQDVKNIQFAIAQKFNAERNEAHKNIETAFNNTQKERQKAYEQATRIKKLLENSNLTQQQKAQLQRKLNQVESQIRQASASNAFASEKDFASLSELQQKQVYEAAGVAHMAQFKKLTIEQKQAYFSQVNLNQVNLQGSNISTAELTKRQAELNATTSAKAKQQVLSVQQADNISALQSGMNTKIQKTNAENLAEIKKTTTTAIAEFKASNTASIKQEANTAATAKKDAISAQATYTDLEANKTQYMQDAALKYVDQSAKLQKLEQLSTQQLHFSKSAHGLITDAAIKRDMAESGFSKATDRAVLTAYAKSTVDSSGNVDIKKLTNETQTIQYVNPSGQKQWYTVKFNDDGSHQITDVQVQNTSTGKKESFDKNKLSQSWKNNLDSTFSQIGKQRQQIIAEKKNAEATVQKSIAENRTKHEQSVKTAQKAQEKIKTLDKNNASLDAFMRTI